MPTIEDWKQAVIRSYRASVPEDEFAAKATPKEIFAVAYYLMHTSGNDAETLALLDDTSSEEPNTQVQLLMDFQAFVADTGEEN
jgi:hypothetical protein